MDGQSSQRARKSHLRRLAVIALLATAGAASAPLLFGQYYGTECRVYYIHPQMHPCRCWSTASNEATIYDSCWAAVMVQNESGYVPYFKCDNVPEQTTCVPADPNSENCGDVVDCYPTNCALVYPGIECDETTKGSCGMSFGECSNPTWP